MASSSIICDTCGTVNQMNQTRCQPCGEPLPTFTSAPTVLLPVNKIDAIDLVSQACSSPFGG